MEDIVGKKHVSVSRTNAELYSYDASLARGKPGVVVFPGDSRETAQIVRVAHREGVPLVPRGFGTNLSGGTIVTVEGLVVCLSRLNCILGIYPEGRYAVVQPGVTNLELQDALAAIGFFYAPDPASQKVATLGGNTGENSGGPRCLKYGVTTNHVLGMEMVLPDGEVVHTGGAALDPPGYDLRGAVVGGEGTLGVVTEITVRILPLSESIITMLATYDSIADAARSVSDIISAGILTGIATQGGHFLTGRIRRIKEPDSGQGILELQISHSRLNHCIAAFGINTQDAIQTGQTNNQSFDRHNRTA